MRNRTIISHTSSGAVLAIKHNVDVNYELSQSAVNPGDLMLQVREADEESQALGITGRVYDGFIVGTTEMFDPSHAFVQSPAPDHDFVVEKLGRKVVKMLDKVLKTLPLEPESMHLIQVKQPERLMH